MSTPHYDTQEGIEAFLAKGLDGLHELSDLRHEAGYKRGERMNDWIVASYWVFDTCGNTMVITEGRPDYHTFKDYPPRVMDMAYYKANAKEDRGFTSTFGFFPRSDERCNRCLEGWDVGSAHDYERYRRDDPQMHKECAKLQAIEQETEWFTELLDQAIHYTKLSAIPNGYSSRYNRPWFLVHTPYGPIKIGWRKRVISIHWDKAEGLADKDGNKLFADEGTTKGEQMIHAWGKDKAIEYLRKLMPHALDQMEKAL